MKKRSIIVFLFCAVAMLLWVSPGFANPTWTPTGCGACHGTGFGTPLHDIHTAENSEYWEGACDSCHATPGASPLTSTCAGCHPYPDTGKCPLVNVHEASESYAPEGPSCITCHAPCEEPVDACETDADCDDEVFCNGVESCSSEGSDTIGECVAGTDPCTGDTPECIEEGTGTCVECIDDADCDEGATCENDVCVDGGCPEGTPDEVLTFDTDGDCLLNKDELKNYSSTLKIAQKAEKTELKAKHSLEKDKYKAIKVNFSAPK